MKAGRCCAVGGTVLPAALMALLPKCPACLAAYLALGTGLGISVAAAAWLQAAAAVISVASLIVVVSQQASGLRDRLLARRKRALVSAGAVDRRH